MSSKCGSGRDCDYCGPGANARKKQQQDDDYAESQDLKDATRTCPERLCSDGQWPDGGACDVCNGYGYY